MEVNYTRKQIWWLSGFYCFYESMGADVTQRQQTYRQYLLDARGRALEEALFRSPAKALGSAEFLANLYRCGGRATARRVGRPRAPRSV